MKRSFSQDRLSPFTKWHAVRRWSVAATLALLPVVLGIGVAPLPAQTPQTSLPYSRGFLVTGDYAVGGVDLREDLHPIDAAGFSTAPISINGVPADADIIAAYLFWETVTTGGDQWKTEAAGVKFRGFDLDIANPLSVARVPLASAGAACFGSGSLVMNMFRGDILRFLPVKVDSNGRSTGKRIVNAADLAAQGLSPHTVRLPVRSGNNVPESAGATMVVVYRDINPNAPLKKVVIYDGNVRKPDVNTAVDLTIAGFYKSAAAKSAKLTHIMSSGQPNSRLTFSFTGAGATAATVIGGNPFTEGPSSQRNWANPTFDVSSLMVPGGNNGEYGETVRTSIYHSPKTGSYDCVTSGAVVFSTSVADVDNDGLPDALEDAPAQTAPNGQQYSKLDADRRMLPAFSAMGGGSGQPDIFVEVNAMWAANGTTYGSLDAPYDSRDLVAPAGPDVVSKTDSDGHNHLPTPYVLKLVGDAFAAKNIRVHFDVGNVAAFKGLGVVNHPDFVDNYNSNEADAYLVPSAVARGGEVIKEVACDPGKPGCHFPAYPGAVPWKLGLQSYRDAPVADSGGEIQVVSQNADGVTFQDLDGTPVTWGGRRRFDPERRGLFKYLLYAHSRGNPKSLPCLTADGQPSPYNGVADLDGGDTDTPSCHDWAGDGLGVGDVNPDWNEDDYHVPTSASGVAELPGSNFMVTLGFWDDFVGRPFARASTTFHELGHTLGLMHGGPEVQRTTTAPFWKPGAVIWGSPTTATWVEANCKPNYLSSMSYLFQIHGLFDTTDHIHLDYSWSPKTQISETSLTDGTLEPASSGSEPLYQTAWFAPASSPLAFNLGVPAAKRYCSGQKLPWSGTPPEGWVAMARVYPDPATAPVDWNGDELLNGASNYDANFDGQLSTLDGFSDWENIRLNQNGAIVTGVSGGSAEGVWFDNAGGVFFDNAGGIFFDNSGVFFDNSGVWFDNSGVWFDNAGGVFFDNSGVFFDNSGVFFDNSGVWFDNAGGVWFDNAGGVFFDNAGGVFFDNSGVFFDNAGGVFFETSGGAELTYEDSLSFGRGRPHKVETCVIGRDTLVSTDPLDLRTCSTANSGEPGYHRVEVLFEQLQVGGIEDYLIQRMSTEATSSPDNAFADAGTVGAHLDRFTDQAELADGVVYTYRVRGESSDEFGDSGWSRSVTETAVNVAPVAVNDPPTGAYSVAAGSTLNVAVLSNDTDVDSPSTSRRVVSNTGLVPANAGTLTLNANGSFTFQAASAFAGTVTFTYAVDNGAWSGDPSRSLNTAPLSVGTVTINVTNDPPACSTVLTPTVFVGSTTTLATNCTDPNGQALKVTAVGAVTGGGSATLTNPPSGSFIYTAPSTPTTATFSYTVSDGFGGTATGNVSVTVTLPPPYGFVNVQNLPAPKQTTAKSGSTVPTKWQWTQNGVAVNTAGQAIVKAYSCAGAPLGTFTAQNPGNGNSFSFDTSSNTWTFNWKLVGPTGVNLPAGSYILQVQNSLTQQIDPNIVNSTCGNQKGALVQVK